MTSLYYPLDFAPRSPLRRIGLVAQEPEELAQSWGVEGAEQLRVAAAIGGAPPFGRLPASWIIGERMRALRFVRSLMFVDFTS